MYTVEVTNGLEILVRKEYKSAWRAIEKWMKLSKEYPMDVQIDADTKEEVISLRSQVKKFEKWFRELHKENKCPYKIEWLLAQVDFPDKLNGCEFNYDEAPCYPCKPFTVG